MTPDQAGFAPFNEAAERFTAAARTFFDGAASASAPIAAEAARTFSDFLREQFAAFQQPWHPAFGPPAGAPPSIADLPAFGATREHQQRWQRAADAWQHIQEAQRRLQRLWSDALREASVAFAARLGPPQPTVTTGAEALRKLYDLWIDCAEDAYARTAHGEAFCSALAELVNASSRLRSELQASMEHWAKSLDLPTRSEINTLARRLKSAEEQLRSARTPPVAAARKAPSTAARKAPSTAARKAPGTAARKAPSTAARKAPSTATRKAPGTAARERKVAAARQPKGAPGKARRTSRKARP
jgi:hypothetical protein